MVVVRFTFFNNSFEKSALKYAPICTSSVLPFFILFPAVSYTAGVTPKAPSSASIWSSTKVILAVAGEIHAENHFLGLYVNPKPITKYAGAKNLDIKIESFGYW